MAGPISISILTNERDALAGIEKVTSRSQRMGQMVAKAGRVAAAGVGLLVVAGAKAASAAADDAQSQTVLANSLHRATGATRAHVNAVEEYIDKTARATGVADDQLRPAFAALARSTGSVEKSQKGLNLALDISAATGKDVGAVSNALAKGYGGTTTALGKLVPGLDKAILKSGDMNKISAELARMTGGTAAKAAATEAGQRARANVAMDEAVETIGARLLPVYAKAAQAGAQAANWLAANESTAFKLAVAIGALAAVVLVVNGVMKVCAAVTAVYHGVLAVASGATKAAAAAQWVLNAALTANPVGLVVVAIAALVAGLVIAYKRSDTFRGVVDRLFGGLRRVTSVLMANKQAFLVLLGPVGLAAAALITAYRRSETFRNGVNAAVGGIKAFGSAVAGGAQRVADFASRVGSRIGSVVSTVTGLPGRVKNALTSAPSLLVQSGVDMIAGLLAGIRDKAGEIASTIQSYVIDKIPGPIRKALGIASPSKVLRKIGHQIMDGLRIGVTDGSGRLAATMDRTAALIEKALDTRFDGKKLAARTRAVMKSLADETAALTKNAKAQDTLQAGNYIATLAKDSKVRAAMARLEVRNLDEVKAKLAELRKAAADYATGVRDSFVSFGSVTSLGEGTGYADANGLLANLRAKVEQAKQYAAMVEQLKKAGLNAEALQQLVSAGVEGGYGTAQTLLSGGGEVIQEVNVLQGQLATAGQGLGNVVADKMYGAGIQATQGLVKGLEAEAKKLDKAAVRLANVLVKAVKKALGIKSPSRVFASLGTQTIAGLNLGIDDTYVRRIGTRAATALQQGFGTPALDAYAKATGSAAATGAVLEVRLTADQTSDLQMGKTLMGKIDVARGSGVKWAAV